MEKKKKKEKKADLTEMKKAPWEFGLSPPDTTVADIMEEDLMETIQHRINELTAELKLLNARPGPLFMTRELLRRDLEREQERLRREQERRGREEQERLERLEEKAAVIIQAFLRTTAVRVKLDRGWVIWGKILKF